jgi:hypothetical protein
VAEQELNLFQFAAGQMACRRDRFPQIFPRRLTRLKIGPASTSATVNH